MASLPFSLAKKGYTFDKNTFKREVKPDPKDKVEIEIGDAKQDDFKPQLKIMRWDNEVNFSLRAEEKEGAVVETEGEVIKYVTADYEVRQFEKPEAGEDGGFEFEWVLPKKPKSNVLTTTIKTKGLDFFYQPELTEEEKKEGAVRPDNVVGSYAVYHSTKGGLNSALGMEYKTGKAFHIYRPEAIDAEGNKAWCELNIDIESELLTVTVPQGFLDHAVYPVIVDPTFGYTTAGGSAFTISQENLNKIKGSKFTLSESADISKLTLYLTDISDATNTVFKSAIYSDSSGPNTLQSSSAEGTWTGTDGWFDVSLSDSLTSADYWLIGWGGDSPASTQLLLKCDSGDANQGAFNDNYNYTGTFPATFPSFTFQNFKYSIYATYTAGSTTSTTTHEYTIDDLLLEWQTTTTTGETTSTTSTTTTTEETTSTTTEETTSTTEETSTSTSSTSTSTTSTEETTSTHEYMIDDLLLEWQTTSTTTTQESTSTTEETTSTTEETTSTTSSTSTTEETTSTTSSTSTSTTEETSTSTSTTEETTSTTEETTSTTEETTSSTTEETTSTTEETTSTTEDTTSTTEETTSTTEETTSTSTTSSTTTEETTSTTEETTTTTAETTSTTTIENACAYTNSSLTRIVNTSGHLGFPAIGKASNGDLIVGYREATKHTGDVTGKWMKIISQDDGDTWSEPSVLRDNASPVDDRHGAIIRLPNGNLLASVYIPQINETPPNTHQPCEYGISTDNGQTFENWTTFPSDGVWFPMVTHDFKTVSGVVYLSCTYRSSETNLMKNVFLKTEDNAATWTILGDISGTSYSESGIYYLGSNKWISVFRDTYPGLTTFSTISTDNGVTWSSPKDIGPTGTNEVGIVENPMMYEINGCIYLWGRRKIYSPEEEHLTSYVYNPSTDTFGGANTVESITAAIMGHGTDAYYVSMVLTDALEYLFVTYKNPDGPNDADIYKFKIDYVAPITTEETTTTTHEFYIDDLLLGWETTSTTTGETTQESTSTTEETTSTTEEITSTSTTSSTTTEETTSTTTSTSTTEETTSTTAETTSTTEETTSTTTSTSTSTTEETTSSTTEETTSTTSTTEETTTTTSQETTTTQESTSTTTAETTSTTTREFLFNRISARLTTNTIQSSLVVNRIRQRIEI